MIQKKTVSIVLSVIFSVHTHILINYSEIKKNIIELNRMKSNRIASIIIESNRELGESFQAYQCHVMGLGAQ